MADSRPLFHSDLYKTDAARLAYEEALRICRMLDEAGHQAFFAGGCVRDALLGRTPKDFDVATDATPDRVREVFGRRRTLAFGASFGVIGVLPPRDSQPRENNRTSTDTAPSKLEPTEVATFRSDGEYSDGRRPDQVRFGDAENDALRRDFTINGLFYDPLRSRVIDFVGGVDDLNNRRLRTIGDAVERFDEDKLRMLRAIRFATVLEFELDEAASAEIRRRPFEVKLVSGERIGAEMRRIFTAESAVDGLKLLNETGLSEFILPELADLDFPRLERAFASNATKSFSSALAVIGESSLSDADKADSTIRSAANLWRLSNEEVRRACFATQHWSRLADAEQLPWSTVQPILIDRDIETALEVADALVTAGERSRQGIELCRSALSRPSEQLNPPPLINGQDLRQSGFQPGPQFREWISMVRRMQLDGELDTRDAALALIRSRCDE